MVPPHRKREIETIANEWRDGLSLSKISCPDMIDVLDRVSAKLGIEVVIKPDHMMPNAEAMANVPTKRLEIPCSVHAGAQRGNPRDRFTIAHEIGHFLLGHSGYTARSLAKEQMYRDWTSRNQEAEADYFAETFLAPYEIAVDCQSIAELSDRFQLSETAASIVWENVQARKRRTNGTKRPLPANGVDFLAAARLRGLKLRSDIDV